MSEHHDYLGPTEAATLLGISKKALRLYERAGLLSPVRTEAGWRLYGPGELDRARDIVALRALGLSLADTGAILEGDSNALDSALAGHETALERALNTTVGQIQRVRDLRAELSRTDEISISEVRRNLDLGHSPVVSFDLPWPWGGETFSLGRLAPLTFIVGPLGCGKTLLAMKLAELIPSGSFIGLDRTAPTTVDDASTVRFDDSMAWLLGDGATDSPKLRALIEAIERQPDRVIVIDLVEDGLDEASQEALAAWLRRRMASAPPTFVMTRSRAILEPASLGPEEALLFCPANHAPPMLVSPVVGSPGFESLDSCLATPEVRARTDGVRAHLPEQ